MSIRFVITTEDDEKFSVISTDPRGGGVSGLAMTDPPTWYPTEWVDAHDIQKVDPSIFVGWFVHSEVAGCDEDLVSGPIVSVVKEVFA